MPKHGMSQKTIVLTAVLFGLIVVGMFVYAKLRSSELQSGTERYFLAFLDRITNSIL
jgi:hypothetical protein